ncbi:MAG: UDP-N-acetylglucosamine--N-acetylmuramyl-(pentapeptide) pyrophosphoryl-undecaprenol N-acetylglucosamine transferase [Planctomycetota bacterium]|jgi:UDP-N-acetylglucosamine--N-acetylmuramyl-(pentapeptide) pyrophosphoryl-undecaprenol N-acetylglucosamine transferase
MTRPPRRPSVLLAGGGTVGHLAPGFAIADALAERGVAARFATPGEAHERQWFPSSSPPPLRIPAPRFPHGAMEVPGFPLRLAVACVRALAVLRRVRPAVVVGLGGWPCVPEAVAAAIARIPLAFVASDRRPGVAVRRLARLADRIYVAEAEAAEALAPHAGVRVTGPVLRRGVAVGRRDPARFGLRPDRKTLLVTGGSLGARALNDRIAEGVRTAVREHPEIAERLQVIHSVGRSGEGVARAYREAGIGHHVTPFIREMGDAYGAADLVVARAGALTCAELAAAGVPAVLVPYPHHADRQQFENARPLVDRGGAVLVEEADLDAQSVYREVLALLEDAPRLERMARAMAAAFPDGAGQIADDLVRLLRWGPTRNPAAG